MSDDGAAQTLYEAVGGEPVFRRLVSGFYRRVAADPVLRPLYPEQELAAAEERLLLFLVQYWGGPDTYSQQRGHPRLRRRHAPFAIGAAERDAWLHNMRAALDDVGLDPAYEQPVWEHLHRAAWMLQNVPDQTPG
jgi:hemoglobin